MNCREKLHIVKAVLFLSLLWIILFSSNGYAIAPGLVRATPAMVSAVDANGVVQSGGTNIGFPGQSVPEPVPYVVDWDNDGKKDLLIGTDDWEITNPPIGRLRFYKNVGTNADPVFNGYTMVRACNNTCDLSVTTGGG